MAGAGAGAVTESVTVAETVAVTAPETVAESETVAARIGGSSPLQGGGSGRGLESWPRTIETPGTISSRSVSPRRASARRQPALQLRRSPFSKRRLESEAFVGLS